MYRKETDVGIETHTDRPLSSRNFSSDRSQMSPMGSLRTIEEDHINVPLTLSVFRTRTGALY